MIKISALNEDSEEETVSGEEVTREALEQIALQQYAKVLELQKKGKLNESVHLLKELLDTELLFSLRKQEIDEKSIKPLLNLKYLCLKNVASILTTLGKPDEAIEAYLSAADLDNTDITLWYRLGTLCMENKKFDTALYALQNGHNCNRKHWPCIDKIVTLLFGLGYLSDCIVAIYEAFELDPDYYRGIVYRHKIYTSYPYIHEYMIKVNMKYSYSPRDNCINDPMAEILLNEADTIRSVVEEQVKENTFHPVLPVLKLQMPILNYTWYALGVSLIHMHNYLKEHSYSHASVIELVTAMNIKDCKNDKINLNPTSDDPDCENDDLEKATDVLSENELNEMSDKNTDTEKVESDADNQQNFDINKQEVKEQKKTPSRRRGSALTLLEQWQWCTKRRSGRKKKLDKAEETINDVLQRLIPLSICPKHSEPKDEENVVADDSQDTMELFKLFQEKDSETNLLENYFGSVSEENDVLQFVNQYTENKTDIINLLEEYLKILAMKWKVKWPEDLLNIYPTAVSCLQSHMDVPSNPCVEDQKLQFYVLVELLSEEIMLNEKLKGKCDSDDVHSICTLESIGIFTNSPIKLGEYCISSKFRYLWAKCHSHLYNRNEDFALDCLYQLLHQFNSLGMYQNDFNINIINFTFKPIISKSEVESYIKFLERNKKLATVMTLYEMGLYEDVLEIVTDSFEYCKIQAKQQQHIDLSLDFAVQMSLILDSYWALSKVEECLKWALTCLNESLKHFFALKSSSADQDKWSLAVIKVLACIEHILFTEGMNILNIVSPKAVRKCTQNLIKIATHQIEDSGLNMSLESVSHWIILHHILQREEDQGRGKVYIDGEKVEGDDIPSSLMVLFVAHDHLGEKNWCCNCEGKLLYFILDTVIPRLQAPALAKPLEYIKQHLEQVVFCLFGHPSKKTRLKYLTDHNVTPHSLTWDWAQKVYCLYKPPDLPVIEGTYTISVDNEQFFQRILALVPLELEPKKYVADIIKFLDGKLDKLPPAKALLPFKMKDIYFLIGDFYFKKDERSKSIKYNLYDVVMNSERFESWAEIALAKATNLSMKLNSGFNIKNDMDYLNEASKTIRCFKKALEIDATHTILWIEFGVFAYYLHSFCSRLLKQASESLSMEDFESLETQKEHLLDTAQDCFLKAKQELVHTDFSERSSDELWLHLYMLGKIAEKQNKSPVEYLGYYLEAAKSLQENDATYPAKINYNSPQHLSIEALEVQYRIHASILKYMEQHENKEIPYEEGKAFLECLEKITNNPFSKKKMRKQMPNDNNDENNENCVKSEVITQASPILKRSVSDAGEEGSPECKKAKLENAAKIRRTVSYESDCTKVKASVSQDPNQDENNKESSSSKKAENIEKQTDPTTQQEKKDCNFSPTVNVDISCIKENNGSAVFSKSPDNHCMNKKETIIQRDSEKMEDQAKDEASSKEYSTSSSSSDSSSDGDSSSDSSDSSEDSNPNNTLVVEPITLVEADISKINSACLDALEDCVSRFPEHYKALYRLAHYHFYYKKGKDIERCRDLMLSTFTSRSTQKLQGLFCDRKNNNFFNGVWRIPAVEIDRPGSFACHMSRCVLLSMEILKEIDDHKTLLDLSLHLQRTPDPDKKYLKDSEREELAQQACSLCLHSLKGQLIKFSQQSDLKSNEIEKNALNMLLLDIYRAYQRVQKTPNAKQFVNLLIDGYKLASTTPITENSNLVDSSMKYCQSLISVLKQQAAMASQEKTAIKKLANKAVEAVKVNNISNATESTSATTSNTPKPIMTANNVKLINNPKPVTVPKPTNPPNTTNQSTANVEISGSLPQTTQEIAASFETYLSQLNDSLMSQQTAAALTLSYMSKLSQLAGFNTLQNAMEQTMQNTFQNSYQTDYYRQFLSSNISKSYVLQQANKQVKHPKRSKSTNKATIPFSIGQQVPVSSCKYTASMASTTKSSNIVTFAPSSKTIVSSKSQPGTSISHLPSYTNIGNQAINHSYVSTLASKPSSSSKSASSSSLKSSAGTSLSKSASITLPSALNTVSAMPLSSSAYVSSMPIHMPGPSYASAQPAHSNTTTSISTIHSKPPLPHQQVSPGKTLQEKLAEKQKNVPVVKNLSKDLATSISKLPSSLTVTKTQKTGPSLKDFRRLDAKKPQSSENLVKPTNPISSSEVIVLDDDSL